MVKQRQSFCGKCNTPTERSLLIVIKGVNTCPMCSEDNSFNSDELNTSDFYPDDNITADMINLDYL